MTSREERTTVFALHNSKADGMACDTDRVPEILTIPARQIKYGDDLFGAGRVRTMRSPSSTVEVRVEGNAEVLVFDREEEVTVRRDA